MGKIMDIRFRRWLYGVGVAIGALLVGYGYLNGEQLLMWLALLTAVLGLTATANLGEKGAEPRRAVDGEDFWR